MGTQPAQPNPPDKPSFNEKVSNVYDLPAKQTLRLLLNEDSIFLSSDTHQGAYDRVVKKVDHPDGQLFQCDSTKEWTWIEPSGEVQYMTYCLDLTRETHNGNLVNISFTTPFEPDVCAYEAQKVQRSASIFDVLGPFVEFFYSSRPRLGLVAFRFVKAGASMLPIPTLAGRRHVRVEDIFPKPPKKSPKPAAKSSVSVKKGNMKKPAASSSRTT